MRLHRVRSSSLVLLVLCAIVAVAALTTSTSVIAVGGPPPGGRYSTCCNYSDMHACRDHPIDPHFAPNDCKFYEGVTGISCETREYFMMKALETLFDLEGTICPSTPFGALIVNHTKGPEIEDAEIMCIGANSAAGNSRAHHVCIVREREMEILNET